MALVKVIEVSKISPYSDSSNPLTELSLPLTFFDAFWFKFPPVQRLFFYKHPELTRSKFDSVILPKLKQSLSFALRHFLPLAGNLKWDPNEPKPVILYSPDDTVAVTVAESNADFSYLSGNGNRVADELHRFVPELNVSIHEVSIMAMQITLLTDQGFCIGVSTHHGILDGQTWTTFLKSWSYICKNDIDETTMFNIPKELTPFLDRSIIHDPNQLDLELIKWWLNAGGKHSDSDSDKRSLEFVPDIGIKYNDLIRGTFVLTRNDLKKMREKVEELQNEVVGSKHLHLSTFVITYAYMLTCMAKANAGGGSPAKSVCVAFTADYRSRLDPPLPSNYFGNCVIPAVFLTKTEIYAEENENEKEKEKFHGFVMAVERLSDMVLGLDMNIYNDFFKKISSKFESVGEGTLMVSIAGSNRFGLYGSDFGWGKPSKVDVLSIDKTGAFSLAECGDGSGGVELGLCLGKQEIEVFTSIFENGLKAL